MTREEAAERLRCNYPDECYPELCKAYDVAIRVLEQISEWTTWSKTYENMVIDAIRSADVYVAYNDPISVEDAIQIAIICTKGSVIESIKQLPPAQQEPCEDAVSRRAAISAITSHSGVVDKSVAKRILVQLPSVQPERKSCKGCVHIPQKYKVPCTFCARNTQLRDRWESEQNE